MASIVPPADRMALVSKLEETIIVDNQQFQLGVNNYGGIIHPNGNQHQVSFKKDLFPQFFYEVGGIKLKKTIAMIYEENTRLVIYDVVEATHSFTFELLPLFSVRGYHSLMHANEAVHQEAHFSNEVFKVKAYDGTPDIFIKVTGSSFHHGSNLVLSF